MKKDTIEAISEGCIYVALISLAALMFVQIGIHKGREVERNEIVAANPHCVLKLN